MARYTASALVLGVHNWGDADKIVTLFTRERGLIRAAAFGARRPKSPLAAGLQMFNEIEAELTEGQRLDTVRTASLLHHPKKLSEDLAAMSYGSFVAELVREKALQLTRDEVPHAIAVDVDEMKARDNGDTYIRATIYVERDSQKGILIGAKGSMLKEIGKLARADIEMLLGTRVFLDLWVKVKKDWRDRDSVLRGFGFGNEQ